MRRQVLKAYRSYERNIHAFCIVELNGCCQLYARAALSDESTVTEIFLWLAKSFREESGIGTLTLESSGSQNCAAIQSTTTLNCLNSSSVEHKILLDTDKSTVGRLIHLAC